MYRPRPEKEPNLARAKTSAVECQQGFKDTYSRVLSLSRDLMKVVGSNYGQAKCYPHPPPLPGCVSELLDQDQSPVVSNTDIYQNLGMKEYAQNQQFAGTYQGHRMSEYTGLQQSAVQGLGIQGHSDLEDLRSEDGTEIEFEEMTLYRYGQPDSRNTYPLNTLEQELRGNIATSVGEALQHPDYFALLAGYEDQPLTELSNNIPEAIVTISTVEKKSQTSPRKDAIVIPQPPQNSCSVKGPCDVLEILLSWYNAYDREEIPWRDIYGLREPKNIPLVCLSFWQTDSNPPKELLRIEPGEVEQVRYSEVDTFVEGSAGTNPLFVLEAHRKTHTPGRWTFITVSEHPQSVAANGLTTIRPWHIIAFPSNAITSSEERICDLYSGPTIVNSEEDKSLYSFDAFGLPYLRPDSHDNGVSSSGRNTHIDSHLVPQSVQTYTYPKAWFDDRSEPVCAAPNSSVNNNLDQSCTACNKCNSGSAMQHFTTPMETCTSQSADHKRNFDEEDGFHPFSYAALMDTYASQSVDYKPNFEDDDGFYPPSSPNFPSSSPSHVQSSSPYSLPLRTSCLSYSSNSASSPPPAAPSLPFQQPYIRRTTLHANAMGSKPLIQTCNANKIEWNEIAAAFGRGACKIITWSEVEAGSVMESISQWPEWIFKDD